MAAWEGSKASRYSSWLLSANGSEQRQARGAGFTGPLMRAHWYTPKSVEALLQTIAGRDELVNCIQSECPADSQVIKNTTDLRMFLAQLLSRDASNDELARFSKAFRATGRASFKSGNAKRCRQFPHAKAEV